MGANKAVLFKVLKVASVKIKLKELGPITTFLGMEINLDLKKRELTLHQAKYTRSLLRRFQKENRRPSNTPVAEGIKLQKANSDPLKEDLKSFQQEVGSLLYLATKTRPDIAFAVGNCARYMSKPNKTHFAALDRIWGYLLRYPDLGLFFRFNQETLALVGYCDADWANCLMNRKSTTGYCFFFGRGNIISWNSALQKTVALSTCEAKYMAMREAIKEVIYLTNML